MAPLLGFTCGGLKPVAPLLARAEPQLKPPSPLRARNGRFRAFFGCRGVAGFNACCSGASIGDGGFTLARVSGCSGVIGCIVATWLCPVREKVRPAWPDGVREREKVRPASPKWPKNAVFRRVGRVYSRVSRWRGRAGRTFSRKSPWRPAAGWSFSWASSRGVPLGACVAPRCRARAAPRSRVRDRP